MTDLRIRDLIETYKTHKHSPYRKSNRARTRRTTDTRLKRISADCGSQKLSGINAVWLIEQYEEWSCGGTKLPWAHSLVSMLRTMFGFGLAFLEDKDCDRLCRIMGELKFKGGKRRTQRITTAQAIAFCAEANRVGRPSLALAQSAMFDFGWRQTDAIGEYVDRDEQVEGYMEHIRFGKLLPGMCWEEIDADLVLHHVTSKRGKLSEPPIIYAPLLLQQLRLMFGSVERSALPARGPIIVNEATGWPYTGAQFRRDWRVIAKAVGIPKDVQNRDSRASAATDALTKNVPINRVREMLGHSKIETTLIYARDPAGEAAAAMKQRSETIQ